MREGLVDYADWGGFVSAGYYANGTTAGSQIDAAFYFAYNRALSPGRLDPLASTLFVGLGNEVLQVDFSQPGWVAPYGGELPLDFHACLGYVIGTPVSAVDPAFVYAFSVEYEALQRALPAPGCSVVADQCVRAAAPYIPYWELVYYYPLFCSRAMSPGACDGATGLRAYVCSTGYHTLCGLDAPGCSEGTAPAWDTRAGRLTCACERVYADPADCLRVASCPVPGGCDPVLPTEATPAMAAEFNEGGGGPGSFVVGWGLYLLLVVLLLCVATGFFLLYRKPVAGAEGPRASALLYATLGPLSTLADGGVVLVVAAAPAAAAPLHWFPVLLAVTLGWNLVLVAAAADSPFTQSRVWYATRPHPEPLQSLVAAVTFLPALVLGALAPESTALWRSRLGTAAAFRREWSAIARWRASVAAAGAFLAQTVVGGTLQALALWSGGVQHHLQPIALALCILAGGGRVLFLIPAGRYYYRAASILRGREWFQAPPNSAAARIFLNEDGKPGLCSDDAAQMDDALAASGLGHTISHPAIDPSVVHELDQEPVPSYTFSPRDSDTDPGFL